MATPPIKYVLDYEGERPEGELVDMSGAMVDELDAVTPEQFETIDDALKRLDDEGV